MTDALAINLEAPCWLFMGYKDKDGYGQTWKNGKLSLAHRYMWEQMRGPVPEGYELDHLCRNPSCVNPQHMEVVTHKVNVLRGQSPSAANARKTHCSQGHPLTGQNLSVSPAGKRRCRYCDRLRERTETSHKVQRPSRWKELVV